MNAVSWKEVEDQFGDLPLNEQLLLLERLVRRMRQAAFLDPGTFDREMEAMAGDPDVQRELRMLPHSGTSPRST